MSRKHVIQLTPAERARCLAVASSAQAPERAIMHSRVLLAADAGPEGPARTDLAIAQELDVSTVTVANIRKTMLREGLEAALRHYRKPVRKYPQKLDHRTRTRLLVLACSRPPEGHARWSVRMLSRHMVELGYVDSLCHESVARLLRKIDWRPAPLTIAPLG